MVMIFSLLILLNLYTLPLKLVDCALLDGNIQTTDRSGGSGEAFIKVSRFHVPKVAKQGDNVRLSCSYELSGERLYAMKLFKDDREFYRYRPSVPPEDQRLNFSIEGVVVDLRRSNSNDVYLRNVNKNSSGTYKCQVSVENTFRSVSAERNMDVKPRNSQSQPINPNGLSYQTGIGSNRQQQQRHTTVQQKQPITTSAADGFIVEKTSREPATQQQVGPSVASTAAAASISDKLQLTNLQIIQGFFLLILLTYFQYLNGH